LLEPILTQSVLWQALSRRANNMKSSVRIATCCAILATAMVRGLSADIPQSSYQLPPAAQVIGYLLQSVNWYRHVYTERQVASDP